MGSAERLEERRRQAVQLLKADKHLSLSAVARVVRASVSSVHRWLKAYRKGHMHALEARPVPGRPSKLSRRQKKRLVKLLCDGPLAAGYAEELWTVSRVRKLIQERFHVRYHRGHVWKLLRALDFSAQVPERRALQRDEHAIAVWREESWPRIKKRPTDEAHP